MEKIHLPQPKVNELHAICKEHDNDPGELINPARSTGNLRLPSS